MKRLTVLTLALAGLTACHEPTRAPQHPAAAGAVTIDQIDRCPAAGDILVSDLGARAGGENSGAEFSAINLRGQAVATDPGNSECCTAGVRYSPVDGFVSLPPLPGHSRSRAADINDRGQVVGSSNTEEGAIAAVLWSAAGEIRSLGTLPGDEFARASGINNAGQVVGLSSGSSSGPAGHAFLWTPGRGMQDLRTLPKGGFSAAADVNKGAQVVGRSGVFTPGASDRFHAFLWTQAGGMRDLGVVPGRRHTISSASALNDRGEVVGFSGQDFSGGESRAFLWTQLGGFRNLGTLPGHTSSFASDINVHGQVVGSSTDANFERRAFLWTAASGMRDLGTLPGGDISLAAGINNHGQIAGSSTLVGEPPHLTIWTLIDRRPNYQVILALTAEVRSRGELTESEARGLVLRLQSALRELDRFHPRVAADSLRRFVSDVQALIRRGRLSRARGQPLIDLASCLIDRLSR